MKEKPILGVTMGDASGAGPEIVVKALTQSQVRGLCRPIVIGDAAAFRQAARIVGSSVPIRAIHRVSEATFDADVIEVIDLHNIDLSRLEYAKVDAMTGQAAYECVVKAVELALAGEIAAIVTSALHKEALNLAGHHFAGHTELLAHLCGVKSVTMLLVAGDFRVSHVSTHIPLREAIHWVKKERIVEVTRLTHDALQRLGIAQPRLAVAGLNPHAGESGLFGDEEEREIRPAVEVARAQGMDVSGPISPDTVFYRMKEGQFDAVVAMYHDQGHIPVKVLAFEQGVNVTLGLPIIRTSVDHGTAFDKAGKGTAQPTSMIEALKLAARMASTVSR
ncbi:MAG: 4-hydroxythreonine-4-phosphate dehydrogenase PdxA [Chloroflexi bacterium]|nr:4-hydroxythreonine-4-phosphate dehydrogenase PdxA [Chloroflexota bacterium]